MNYDLMQEPESKLIQESSDENEETPLNSNSLPLSQDKNLIFANITNLSYKEKKLSQLYLISTIYFLFVIFEIIGGYYSNSIALMSDAAHSFSDCFCFLIFIVSIIVTQKGTTTEMSYGFHRGEIIGMLLSVTITWALSFWLIYTSIYRLFNPQNVNGLIMFLIALTGLIFNLLMGNLLIYLEIGHNISFLKEESCSGHKHNYNELSCRNIRGSFKHIIGDSIQNSIIIIAGIVIYFFPKYKIADPICTLIFTGLVLYNAYQSLYGCIVILMEGAPLDINVDKIENDLLQIEGVIEVHDLHIWCLSIGKISMSCHLISNEPQTSLKIAREMIKDKYMITHTTIQVEFDDHKEHKCNFDLLKK